MWSARPESVILKSARGRASDAKEKKTTTEDSSGPGEQHMKDDDNEE